MDDRRVVATSEVSVSLTLDNVSSLPAIVDELKNLGDVEVTPKAALIFPGSSLSKLAHATAAPMLPKTGVL